MTQEQPEWIIDRAAVVRAALTVTLYGLPQDFRTDLQQEAVLELWRRRSMYDPQRGSWSTFSERIIANRIASVMRHLRSERSGLFREDSLDKWLSLPARDADQQLRADVARVLDGIPEFDRRVAICLIESSAVEASRHLRVSRATIYRSIGRLRAAFIDAGLQPLEKRPRSGV